jgi:2,4-dienoyl-CoA reductase (NADPH2)
MMSGQLEDGTAKKLGWWQRVILYLASPLLQSFLTPSTIRCLTRLWMPLGKRVAIIGGDFVGCELAEFLAERGRKVTILEGDPELAPEMPMPNRRRLIESLRQSGTAMLTGVNYEEITEKGIIITTREGQRQVIEADTIVLAEGIGPQTGLFQAVEGKVLQIYLAGDCASVRLIRGAIADGASIALTI